MKSYHLTFKQALPISLTEAWDFFSSPHNLVKITPDNMAFEVTSAINPQQPIYPGMIITYKVSPIGGIKLNWMTEITQVEQEKYFIDEQRFGPFKFWHHQHHFKTINHGVEMTDILTYGLPLGFIGQITHQLLVAHRIKSIFAFRAQKITELFGNYPHT